MLTIVAAVNKKNCLGLDGTMPWHCPEDLQFFKRVTMDKTLVMGRKTFDGLPKALKGRTILKVSRTEGDIQDLDAYLKLHAQSDEDIFVAGGGEIYKQAIPYVSKIYLSIIDNDVMGDTFFPEISHDFKLEQKIQFETFTLNVFTKEGDAV